MKRLSEQSHYDVLEIPHGAAWRDIRQAYELARKTYGGDCAASHPLFTDEERAAIFTRIEAAYRTLSDPITKRQYDATFSGVTPPAATPQTPIPADPIRQAADDDGPVCDVADDLAEGEITGERLRQIRLRQGRSLAEIAERTRINPDYFGWIETEAMAHLPAEIYLRNYVRQYAEALRLDAKRVVDAYLERYRQRQKRG